MPLTFTSSGKVSDATYSKPSSNKSSNTSSNSSGGGGYISFFDRFDGGGPGRSGARFSSGDTGGLDQNQDNYISEQEYQRGQSNSESNADRGKTGQIGDAYNNSRGVISNFSNAFGALPRGSIRQEAALGPQYGTQIETKNMAKYLQGGGALGALGRGVSGFLNPAINNARKMAMAPVRAYRGEGAPPNPVGNPEQAAKSYDSIFNTGSADFSNLPEAQRRAIVQGTRSLNPLLGRAMSLPANVISGEPDPENDLFRDEASSEFGQNVMSGDISLKPYYQVYELGDNRYSLYADGVPKGSFSGDALREENIIN